MGIRDIISDIISGHEEIALPILAVLLVFVLVAGAMMAGWVPPHPPARDGTWVHVTPPAGSPFTGCAVQARGGAVCWTTQEELEAP